jgi:hypothetical protein
MRSNFPIVKIGSVERKAFSMDLSGGGSSPSVFRVSFITENENYETSSSLEWDIDVVGFYRFTGYIVSINRRNGIAGKITELTIIDSSVKLDKIFVGLKGKHGPPTAPLLLSNGQNKAAPETVNLYELSPIPVKDEAKSTTNSVSIFRTQGNFPTENLILLGNAIDPCKNIEDGALDPCDPCSTVLDDVQRSRLDCEKNRSFQLLDVDYTFYELIKEAQKRGIDFVGGPTTKHDYRAQYTGTLREVLNNWCQDFGYSFYWKDNSVYFFNLQQGIVLNESSIDQVLSDCEIEERSETLSIENSSKTINIAYFGKAGEIKEYDCSQKEKGSDTLLQTISMRSISLSRLLENNKPLIKAYNSAGNFIRIVAAGRYSKDFRDLFCWNHVYNYSGPSDVRVGNHNLMGWNIKGVCYAGVTDEQVAKGYSKGSMTTIYNHMVNTLSTKERAKQLVDAGAYFVVAEPFENKAFEFEKNIADSYCGKFWIHDTNYSDPDVVNPDGQSRTVRGLYGNVNYILPNLYLNHPYVRSSKDDLIKDLIDPTKTDTNVVILERNQYFDPDPNSAELDSFLKFVDVCKIEEVDYSADYVSLQPNDKVFLVYPNGGAYTSPMSFQYLSDASVTHRLEREVSKGERKLGLTNSKQNEQSVILEVRMPSESSYKIQLRPKKSVFNFGPYYAIIPKFEAVITGNNTYSENDYVGVNVNYLNITDADLSRLKFSNGKCYIGETEVFTYAQSILSDLSVDVPKQRKTISYSIFGIPQSVMEFFNPSNGLSSFSVRMDSSGTKTSLVFSNLLPVERSTSVKRHELNYLFNNQSVKTFINKLK